MFVDGGIGLDGITAMPMKKLDEPVYTSSVKRVNYATKVLANHRIKSDVISGATRTNKASLLVSKGIAEKSRQILSASLGLDKGILSKEDASYWTCHFCNAPVEPAMNYCQKCGEFIGDPHAL